ncbi:MAG: hypothetical protein GX897_02635 [Clostridiales bacterium]|nr:hypothetical protein [Clostridiales bacterium]
MIKLTINPNERIIPVSPGCALREDWLIMHDPEDRGRDEGWQLYGLPEEALPAVVPSLVNMYYPDGFGVAWYSLCFTVRLEDDDGLDCLLRFGMAEYWCEVWLNGQFAGYHRGSEDPFTIDITRFVDRGAPNRLVIRLSKPHDEPMNNLTLEQIPHRNQRRHDHCPGSQQNVFGLREEIILLQPPKVRVSDLYIYGDIKSCCIKARAEVYNGTSKRQKIRISADAGLKRTGMVMSRVSEKHEVPPGKTVIPFDLPIADLRLWSLEDPNLYFVNLSLKSTVKKKRYTHKLTGRTGFRDFRVGEDGYFRLNGKRIFLRGAHSGNNFPYGIQLCCDPDLMRRDFDMAKTAGINCVRFISGYSQTEQLDYCDEIGLLVYQEPISSWMLQDSPMAKELYLENLYSLVKRDRSHPSVVIWGLLNETPANEPFGMAFEAAKDCLDELTEIDNTRLILLNSGRFDGYRGVGSLCNPGAQSWQCIWNEEEEGSNEKIDYRPGDPGGLFRRMGDMHAYPTFPISWEDILLLREYGDEGKAIFISEFGIGSLFDVVTLSRRYEQECIPTDAPDYRWIRMMYDGFMADYDKYRLYDIYPFPQDMMRHSALLHSRQRRITFNIVRANPRYCGYSITGLLDHAICGEGLWTIFREYKPGAAEALADGLAPLKWCLFVNPTHVYSGRPFTIEGILADEDILADCKYEATVRIFGACGNVWEKTYNFRNILPRAGLSIPVFSEELTLELETGTYELCVELTEGAAATDGRMTFHVTNPADMPKPIGIIGAYGLPENITALLETQGVIIDTSDEFDKNSVILVCNVAVDDREAVWKKLYTAAESGATVLALSPEDFTEGDRYVCRRYNREWLYHKEYVALRHPYFDSIPAYGIMDSEYFGRLLNGIAFLDGEEPDEVAACCLGTGMNTTSTGYDGGFNIGRYKLGAGSLVVNSLDIPGQIGRNPAADLLLLNMLRHHMES